MKKAIAVFLSMAALTASAQTAGRVETYDMEGFRLHVYHTNDVMNDASYIIEGPATLVTMEHPLFKKNIAEFDALIAGLNKPVEARIADYHVSGTADAPLVMAEGMTEFARGPLYDGMMQQFARLFGDTMGDRPTGTTTEAAFDTTHEWAGTTFRFMRGAATDFPAASLLIGGQLYYTHWTPTKAHASHLQVNSPEAIDAEIAEAEKSLASGAVLFIGGHGGAARADAVKFKIAYLKTLHRLLSENDTPETLVAAIQNAYPGLPGSEGLPELAEALCAAKQSTKQSGK